MNSDLNKKKKISEYKFEDIKKFFSDNIKKISSSIILLEIGNRFLNIGVAKSKKDAEQLASLDALRYYGVDIDVLDD